MSYLASTREQQLSQLIGCTIEQLDISEAAFLAAKERYDSLRSSPGEFGSRMRQWVPVAVMSRLSVRSVPPCRRPWPLPVG